jgi:hypothetical protein
MTTLHRTIAAFGLALMLGAGLTACSAAEAEPEATSSPTTSSAPSSEASSPAAEPSTPAPEQSIPAAVATNTTDPSMPADVRDAAVAATVDLIQRRYDLVKAGDFEAACALYTPKFTELFMEVAGGSTCVEAHTLGLETSDVSQAKAVAMGRTGIVPFYYIPSAIEIDESMIKVDAEDRTFQNPFTVISLDPFEFEDGVGALPGWLEAQDYAQRIDGEWKFAAPTDH